LTKKPIPKRRARVKPAPQEPLAWELAGKILLSMIMRHPYALRVTLSDVMFVLRIFIDHQDFVTRKQRSQLEEIAAIVEGKI
jgi:hypothetical protein